MSYSKEPTVTKKTRGRADREFSKWIRRGGVCERCGKRNHEPKTTRVEKDAAGTAQLQCAHISSRRRLVSRWEELNALCFCFSCHSWMESYPAHFAMWLQENRLGYWWRQVELYEVFKGPQPRCTESFVAEVADRYKALNKSDNPNVPKEPANNIQSNRP
jgi:hypothetical protein